jgi:hypothetical protein
MRIECRIADLHSAIDAEWQRNQEERQDPTCPECDGSRISEDGRCWDCTASDYLGEEEAR